MLIYLHDAFENLGKQWGCKVLEFNGELDRVHLLLALNPKTQPSKLVNNFKTVSSRLLRRDFSAVLSKYYYKPVFWSRSYCLISCGGAPLTVIKQYIEQQAGAD